MNEGSGNYDNSLVLKLRDARSTREFICGKEGHVRVTIVFARLRIEKRQQHDLSGTDVQEWLLTHLTSAALLVRSVY